MLKLNLVYRDVTEYNQENEDWSGETFSSPYDNSIEIEDTSIASIVEGINSLIFGETVEDYIIIEDDLIKTSQIEDGDGLYDPEGNYLVDYSFEILEELRVPLQDLNS